MKKILTISLLSLTSLFSAHAVDFPPIEEGNIIRLEGHAFCGKKTKAGKLKRKILIEKIEKDSSFDMFEKIRAFSPFTHLGIIHHNIYDYIPADKRKVLELLGEGTNCFNNNGDFADIKIQGQKIRACKIQYQIEQGYVYRYFAPNYPIAVRVEQFQNEPAPCDGYRMVTDIILE